MFEKFPQAILKKYPQFKQITAAITEFKNMGSSQTKCMYCSSIIEVTEKKLKVS